MNAPHENEIYIKDRSVTGDRTKAWRLKKEQYGLKQSAREWNLKQKGLMEQAGLIQSQSDPWCFFSPTIRLAGHVDDSLITGSSQAKIDNLAREL